MINDRLLAKKVLEGETEAFRELITSYYPGLYGFLIKMGIPASQSRDLAHEIFLNVYRSLYRYNDRWAFSTWFYKVATGMALSHKRRHPQPVAFHPDIPEFLLPDREPEEDESLNSLLDPIHDEARSMFILHYHNGLHLREIGRIFGLSVSSVRMRMVRARKYIIEHVFGASLPPGAAGRLAGKIKKEVSCGLVPVDSIMSLIESNGCPAPGFWKLLISPNSLRRIWPTAASIALGIILLCLLIIPSISKPFWDSVMTIFDKEEQPASADIPSAENTGTSITFTAAGGLLSGDELVARLNEMGDASWQVVHANGNRIVMRNSHIAACWSNGEFYQLIDLDSFGLGGGGESPEAQFSFSPTGEFLVAGISAREDGTSEGQGVYLFNVSDRSFYRLSELGMDQVVHAWAPGGNYLVYAARNKAGTIFLLDMQTLRLEEMESNAPVRSLYVTGNGGVGVFTGDMVMTAYAGDNAWKSETVRHEPFYINPDSSTVWYVLNGVIMKHVIGSDQDVAIDPGFAAGNGGLLDTYITDYRLVGSHLVFRMRNGYSGTMNMRTANLKVFNTSREMKTDLLPWCMTTPSGARVMFDNDRSFLIVSEGSVTTPHIPGYSTLAPRHTSWVDEENIAFVRMVDEEEPQAGELSIYTINVLTGEVKEIYRSVDKEPVLNTDEPGSSSSIPPVQRPPQDNGKETIYETDKATGSKVESYVKTACKVKNGPGDNYTDIGEIKENEIIIYNTRVVNGWCLAQKVSGMVSYYDTRNSFWIRAENIHFYDRYSLPAGIITADKVRLSKISLDKGNLIRVIIKGEDKSYVIPDTTDSNFGITGWISNNSYTTDFDRVYFNQAYLKSRSTVYSEPDPNSSHVSDFTDYMARTGTDAFVNLTGEAENGFLHVALLSGMSGWVREQDIYLPGSGTAVSPPEEAGNLDINGDGIQDRISFTTDGSRYTLTVNQSKADGHGFGVQSQYKLVDIDLLDSYYEIVIEEHGNSGGFMSTFYYYDGEKLVLMGKVQGLCGNTDAVRGDGSVRSLTRGDIFETWFFTREYRLNMQHKLVEVPSAFYEKIGYRDAGPLKLKIESLPFTVSPGSSDVSFVLNQGESVYFVGSDNQRWCLFQTPDGRNGWLEVYDYMFIGGTGLQARDVFDGLNFAD
ncbi:MAG: sigma-70 family RNA polymerase sigma factor [Clostridiaceae bacterium]|jgi:RNA polymerase sigma factor (sigma-70 family)|nr:sigma-70 family RNA polymerase sigma factor [Clostridiaceae bacterium]